MVQSESRKLVLQTLAFENPKRAPRQIWDLPWTYENYPDEIKALKETYPEDITWCPQLLKKPPHTVGDPYAIGEFTDEWGSLFQNKMQGVIGEVKEAVIKGDEWEDRADLRIPLELLDVDVEAVNRYCARESRFVVAATSVRIFERLQFLRGTEELLMDFALRPEGMTAVIAEIHTFFCGELEAWAKTDVDALFIQDDWGTQLDLLISPAMWTELFKPLYKEYVEIAHRYGKKLFMHSDGQILSLLPHLIEIGVDALNSQIFCIGLERLAPFAGKITFWGEMDRQYLLPKGSLLEIREAVRKIKQLLWRNGGCIAQCDFGIGVNPDNVFETFHAWREEQEENNEF